MTATTLASAAGVVLSLALSYVPGLADYWALLDGATKRLAMAALLLAVAGGALALSCAGLGASLGLALTCDGAGAEAALRALLAALVSSQAAYTLTPRRALPADAAG